MWLSNDIICIIPISNRCQCSLGTVTSVKYKHDNLQVTLCLLALYNWKDTGIGLVNHLPVLSRVLLYRHIPPPSTKHTGMRVDISSGGWQVRSIASYLGHITWYLLHIILASYPGDRSAYQVILIVSGGMSCAAQDWIWIGRRLCKTKLCRFTIFADKTNLGVVSDRLNISNTYSHKRCSHGPTSCQFLWFRHHVYM